MGMLSQVLKHPDEFFPLLRMAIAAKQATKLPKEPGLAFCYDMLNCVSRSFAVVIQQLPNPLRDAVCVFYLVLRGLDTVEDDMALSDAIKLPALLSFHEDIYNRDFNMDCGYKHYKRLMNQFHIVVDTFLGLDEPFRQVIADITRRMGEGMKEFIQRDVVSIEDYDKYCHYVAGLVGIGLSDLFASSGLEKADMTTQETLSNHMGLFLQKTNIIRDYLEDIVEEPAPRMFWPREIWGQYADSLDAFKHPENREAAIRCLNHMIVDALRHLPFCVEYMQQLHHTKVFRFCAIPQIMAIGTLANCYNNGKVFEGVVKMRRGQTARVFDSCDDMQDLMVWFLKFLAVLQAKVDGEVDESDPNLAEAREAVTSNRQLCLSSLEEWRVENPAAAYVSLMRDLSLVVLSSVYTYYSFDMGSTGLPVALKAIEWGLADYRTLHQLVSLALLLLCMLMVIFTRR